MYAVLCCFQVSFWPCHPFLAQLWMILRSGKILPILIPSPLTVTMATANSSTNNDNASTNPPLPPPPSIPTAFIKLLHQDPSLKKFSGDDPNYSAITFLQQCEDSIKNSSVTQDGDKISFIRSHIVHGSLAEELMRANAFNTSVNELSYAQFRDNFLLTFGSSQEIEPLLWSFHLADSLTTKLGTLGVLRGMAHAADTANEALTALQSTSWFEDGKLSAQRLRSILEFQYYILYLTPQERRFASTIDFKPGDRLLDFVSKLRRKMREAPPPSAPVAPVVVSEGSKPSPSPATSSSGSQNPQTSRPPLTCSHCHKNGHTYDYCFLRKKQNAKNASKKSSAPVSASGSSGPKNNNQHKAPSSKSPRPSQTHDNLAPSFPAPKWCHIHERGNHSTDECFTIIKLKQRQTVSAVGLAPQPSGEAERQSQPHPS